MALRRDSCGSARSDEAPERRDDARERGGALDALWRFEAAHRLLLNEELASSYAAFVDELYEALESARDALERQSVRVLAVLHDKDTRIRELEERGSSMVDSATQTARRTKHEEIQCALGASESERALQGKVEEQEEQIEVLLDELDRIQKVLSESEAAATAVRVEAVREESCMQATATQTDEGGHADSERSGIVKELTTTAQSSATQTDELPKVDTEAKSPEATLSAIAALQLQLEAAERTSATLFEELRRKQAKEEEEADLDTVEKQLTDAIRAMEVSSQCCVNALAVHEYKTSCLDLEHALEVAVSERGQLIEEVLSLRAALCQRSSSLSLPVKNIAIPSVRTPPCKQVTCHHGLRRILHLVQIRNAKERDKKAKTLRKELQRALRDGTRKDLPSVVGRIAVEWMQWEFAHVQELKAMHRLRQEEIEMLSTRSAHLVDEIHRLRKVSIDLQTQLTAVTMEAPDSTLTYPTEKDPIETDRRVLALEQELLLRKEQLEIANRAVATLSSTSESNVREVRFTDGAVCTQTSQTSSSAITKKYIAELTGELQRLKETEFKRFLPSSTSQHTVVEYFRLEKECLHLRHRLREKEELVRELRQQLQQLENTCASLHTGYQSRAFVEAAQGDFLAGSGKVNHSQKFTARLYQRFLEDKNVGLRLELESCHSRIVHLERKLEALRDSTHPSIAESQISATPQLVRKLNEYHQQAREAFHAWKQHIQGLKTAENGALGGGDQIHAMLLSYGILLDHYDAISVQLRLLQDSTLWSLPSHSIASGLNSKFPHQTRLLAKIRVLEDRLLQSHFCASCGEGVPGRTLVNTSDISTMTDRKSATDAFTQMSSHDRRRVQLSKRVQADLGAFHGEPSPRSEPIDSLKSNPATQGVASMVIGTDDVPTREQLEKTQDQLEASLARINELTSQKEKLQQRLDEAHTQCRKHAKEKEKLCTQVEEYSRSNPSLACQLRLYESVQCGTTKPDYTEPLSRQIRDLQAELNHLKQMLTAKENANAELVQQVYELKESNNELEWSHGAATQTIGELQAKVASLGAVRVEERNKQLDDYMSKVNQSLASIERDKERLYHENRDLKQKLLEIEREAVLKEARGTRSCSTETDEYVELSRLQQLPEHQSLETQLVMMQNELETERRVSEQLRASRDHELKDKDRAIESQRIALESEKAKLCELIKDIKLSHRVLQQEFDELRMASEEARQEADKRIVFLVACVEECSRLVDVSGPVDEALTSRDIYDAIIAVSNRVVASVAATPSSNKKQKKALSLSTQSAPDLRLESQQDVDTTLATEAAGVSIHTHSQLQAETWRVRVAKLELSLRAATLKNKSFEEMVSHLELQMQGLKEEVKERMSKESLLLTKQGQMKVELANLKAQNATLTSRLAEACGDFKRCQDASRVSESELARLRSALQRKTELLLRQKARCDETQAALDNSLLRVAELQSLEKNYAATQLKQKDQMQQLHELRQQWTVCRDVNSELRTEVDKKAEQIAELQSRVKALRLDNGRLREQLKELKNALKENVEVDFKSKVTDATVATAVLGDGRTSGTLNATAAVDMLAAQAKTLKRRVLQKQDVIIAYKTKVAELDTELTLQRTKLFDLSQSHRQLQQSMREKEQSLLQGVTHLKEELESSVATKAEQLDGLRASIFDACEVFIQCDAPSPPSASPSASSHSSLTWVDETDEDSGTDALLQELRRYADLSPDDLANLHITSSTREPKLQRHESKHRFERAHWQQLWRKRGQRVLQELEHALEVTPQDCRAEICQVLELLIRERAARGS